MPQEIQLKPDNKSTLTPVTSKRRRVTRACDECRKKKVKCDGKQPCIHCTVYSYNCTYEQPNIRNKKSAIPPRQQSFSMNTLLSGGLQSSVGQNNVGGSSQSQNSTTLHNLLKLLLPKLNYNENPVEFNFDKFKNVFHYVQAKNPGVINLNELSELYFDGPSVSLSSSAALTPSLSSHQDYPGSATSNDDGHTEFPIILPSKPTALDLIYTTWNKACVLFRFYHRPSLLEEVDLLYSLDPNNYTDRQQKFLPFMYSILACGLLFSRLAEKDNLSLEDDGFRYFMAARKLIDITNVGDIISIQTIVMMVIYLQCSARLSTCYLYIGIALRSALKEGLHRNLSIFQTSKKNKLTPIEIDTRKRLFFTIYKMDIYINSLLGLPRSIQEDEFDQEFPVELDDENITNERFAFEAQQGKLSSSGCANHHTKLMIIMSHVVRELYPIKLQKPNGPQEQVTAEYTHSKVTEIEFELKQWLDNLPRELVPTDFTTDIKNGANKFVLANCYLHLAFLNCQIMLYRPFIHFISSGTNIKHSDPRSLIRGRNCIKVARMVVKLANKMIDNNLLVGTYWFSMYTIFFSIACLVYYFHSSNYLSSLLNGANYAGVLFDDDLNVDKIKEDIEVGKKLLDNLKHNSNASLRIFNILNNLFDQLNRRTANNNREELQQLKEFIKPSDAPLNASLESTFQKFDIMNNFNINRDTKPSPALEEKIAPMVSSESPLQRTPLSRTSSKNSVGQPGRPVPSMPTESEMAEFQPPFPESRTNGNTFADDYMPGLVDKLDAQIFGRILPPYMLEKNMQVANVKAGLDTRVDSPGVANNELGQYPNNDFTFLYDDDNLEHLDPFSVDLNNAS